MASTADIKNGLCIRFKDGIYKIVEFQHVKPGKGPAFVRTKLKNLSTGRVIDNTIPAGHKIEVVRVERRNFQFLYKDDSGYHMMNNESYEQVAIDENLLEGHEFLTEGVNVDILYHSETDEIVNCELPDHIVLEVTYAEPGVKGDTANAATKPATLSSGAKIQVPLFINEGEKIKVDVKNKSYMERVKS